MPMNPRKLIPTQEPGVLDFAPGAAAAYSLRNLSLSYAGPVVTVRRSTDSAEADFTASEVSDGTLAAWCGGGDGFVKQWWSQTGSNHASQSTAGYQPQIVDSGVLVTDGGKAAVRFETTNATGTNIRLQTAAFPSPLPQPISVFVLCARSATDDRQYPFDGRQNQMSMGGDGAVSVYQIAAGSTIESEVSTDTDSNIFSGLFDGPASLLRINGATVITGDAGANSLDGLTIGNIRGTPSPVANNYTFIGTISELIIYPTDQTAFRTRIEGNMNRHFGVF